MRKVGLNAPIEAAAAEVEKLVCPYCGKECKTEEALAKHIETKHPEAAGGNGGETPME
ncbi:MAG: C2H2-type zinc finger protein [Pseudoflavonifractor sp.]